MCWVSGLSLKEYLESTFSSFSLPHGGDRNKNGSFITSSWKHHALPQRFTSLDQIILKSVFFARVNAWKATEQKYFWLVLHILLIKCFWFSLQVLGIFISETSTGSRHRWTGGKKLACCHFTSGGSEIKHSFGTRSRIEKKRWSFNTTHNKVHPRFMTLWRKHLWRMKNVTIAGRWLKAISINNKKMKIGKNFRGKLFVSIQEANFMCSACKGAHYCSLECQKERFSLKICGWWWRSCEICFWNAWKRGWGKQGLMVTDPIVLVGLNW